MHFCGLSTCSRRTAGACGDPSGWLCFVPRLRHYHCHHLLRSWSAGSLLPLPPPPPLQPPPLPSLHLLLTMETNNHFQQSPLFAYLRVTRGQKSVRTPPFFPSSSLLITQLRGHETQSITGKKPLLWFSMMKRTQSREE